MRKSSRWLGMSGVLVTLVVAGCSGGQPSVEECRDRAMERYQIAMEKAVDKGLYTDAGIAELEAANRDMAKLLEECGIDVPADYLKPS